MGILDDLAPYMTLLRFFDDAGIQQSYYRSVYSNILDSGRATPSPQEYTTGNATGGLLRVGSFTSSFELDQLDCYFAPVADGEQWRAVVRTPRGALVAASEYRIISGEADHRFEFDPPVPLLGRTQYAFGIEAADPTQQATAFYNNLPNEMFEGGFRLDGETILGFEPPTVLDQAIVFGTGYAGRILRVDHASGRTVSWEVDAGGTGDAFETKVFGITPNDEVVASIGQNLVLLDIVDGSEIWSYDLGNNPYSGALIGDFVYLHLDNGDLAVADLAAATPPNVAAYSLDIDAPNYENGPKVAVKADGTALYMVHSDNEVRMYLTNGGFTSYEWAYGPGEEIESVAANDEMVFIGTDSAKLYGLDAVTGEEIDEYVASGTGTKPDNQILHLAVSPVGDVYCTQYQTSTTIPSLFHLDTESHEWRTSGVWTETASMRPSSITLDGESIYVGSSDDWTRVARVDALTMEMVWDTINHSTASNSYLYIPTIAVRASNFDSIFPTLAEDHQLALRLYRRIDWSPLSSSGYLRGNRHWQTFIQLNPIEEDVRALVPEIGLVAGAKSQAQLQFQDEDGTWKDLDFATRTQVVGTPISLRLVIEPADIIEEWTPRDIGNFDDDDRTDVSNNRLGWDATTFDPLGSWDFYNDPTYGRRARNNLSSYDDPSHGLMMETSGQDGDVEFRFYGNSTPGVYFMFRVPNVDPETGHYVELNVSNLEVYDHQNGLMIDVAWPFGSGTTHPLVRVIWKDSRVIILEAGRLVADVSGVANDDPDFHYFGFNTYYSNVFYLYKVRGRGMAVGPVDAADGVRVDFLSIFHERAA